MQKFEFLRQPLMGELAMSRKKERKKEREKEREKNAICSGHLRLCQQPRAAHALRSDQKHDTLYIKLLSTNLFPQGHTLPRGRGHKTEL